MEGMVNDLSLAKEKQQTFEVWQREEGRTLPIEMTVQVLTTGFWPQYKVRMPAQHPLLPAAGDPTSPPLLPQALLVSLPVRMQTSCKHIHMHAGGSP
jgi:hypothetical protein